MEGLLECEGSYQTVFGWVKACSTPWFTHGGAQLVAAASRPQGKVHWVVSLALQVRVSDELTRCPVDTSVHRRNKLRATMGGSADGSSCGFEGPEGRRCYSGVTRPRRIAQRVSSATPWSPSFFIMAVRWA